MDYESIFNYVMIVVTLLSRVTILELRVFIPFPILFQVTSFTTLIEFAWSAPNLCFLEPTLSVSFPLPLPLSKPPIRPTISLGDLLSLSIPIVGSQSELPCAFSRVFFHLKWVLTRHEVSVWQQQFLCRQSRLEGVVLDLSLFCSWQHCSLLFSSTYLFFNCYLFNRRGLRKSFISWHDNFTK